jgi:hypothetical protein
VTQARISPSEPAQSLFFTHMAPIPDISMPESRFRNVS